NPFHSILTQPSPEGLLLASLCADTMLLWRLRLDTLMEALAPACPAVSVACGAAHLSEGDAYAAGVGHRFLTAADFAVPAGGGPRPRRMAEIQHRVTVRPGVGLSFGAGPDEADFVVAPDLDRYNFDVLPAQNPIGRVRPGAGMPLQARDVEGRDVTDRLFRITGDGAVVVRHDVMPLMMTTTVRQARRDCLFYTAQPADVGGG